MHQIAEVKKFLWKLLFYLPGPLVRKLFSSRAAMRVLFPRGFSLNGIEDKLESVLEGDAGFFVEIGGNDGLSQSNTKRLELLRGWRGVLVEPHPGNFNRMALTRHPETHKFMAACVPFGYQKAEVELEYADLMTVSTTLNSDIPNIDEHLIAGEKNIRWGRREVFAAPARTLNSILEESQAPRVIDFFSLDVEGAEMEVLAGVDFNQYTFEVLLVESRSPEVLTEFLGSKGYKPAGQLSAHDFLFTFAGDQRGSGSKVLP